MDTTEIRKVLFEHRFGVALETGYSIFTMGYVSQRADGEPFTLEKKAWMDGFDDAASLA